MEDNKGFDRERAETEVDKFVMDSEMVNVRYDAMDHVSMFQSSSIATSDKIFAYFISL